ncbi:hypothetical protein [Nonomuraea sp. NPDC050786]|uniref:hypothetical protein n=1 Tax=Nonomuraea sp. NPDC050786 TaxID=3154840 RepID=UPI0033D336F9
MKRAVRIRSVTVSVTIAGVAAIAMVLVNADLSPAALLGIGVLVVAAAAGVLWDVLRRPTPRPPLSEAYQRGYDSVDPPRG